MDEYRIRWGNVIGPWRGFRRMCLAERRVWLLGVIPIWWPLLDGDWHPDEASAERDIENDRWLRQPLPTTRIL